LDGRLAAGIDAAFHHPVLQQLLGLQLQAPANGRHQVRLAMVERQLQLMQSQRQRLSVSPIRIIGG
jgi:hypothetical protein